jgi:LPS-assembly protein
MNKLFLLIGSVFCVLISKNAFADNKSAHTTLNNTLDWYDRSELPETVRLSINPSCPGGLVDPMQYGLIALDDSKDTINVSADNVGIASDGGLDFDGNVTLSLNNTLLIAEHIHFDSSKRNSEFSGGATLRQTGLALRMDRGQRNFDQGNAQMHNGEFALHESQMHGSSLYAVRSKNGNIRLDNTVFSRCDPNNPFWQLSASTLEINYQTGDATAWHTVLKIKGVPIFYTPWLSYPIDDRRKSGLLFPSFAIEGLGTSFQFPLYWNIAPNVDATLSPQLFVGENKGLMLRNEFRYLTKQSSGQIDLNFSPFMAYANAETHNDAVHNDYRASLTSSHSSTFSNNLSLQWQYEYASDESYYADFDATTNKRTTPQWLKLGWTPKNLSMSLLVEQQGIVNNLLDIRGEDAEYQKLPQLDINWNRPSLLGNLALNTMSSSTWFELNSSNQQFIEADKSNGNTDIVESIEARPQGLRLYNELDISYPVTNSWFNVRPNLGVRSVVYKLDGVDQPLFNAVPYLSLNAITYLEKDWWLGKQKYRHTIEPEIYFSAVPFIEQENQPNFDTTAELTSLSNLRFSGYDRVGDMMRVGGKFTSRWIRQGDGLEQWKFSLAQVFNLQQERITEAQTKDKEDDFSAGTLNANLKGRLTNYWSVNLDTSWDLAYDTDSESNDFSYDIQTHNLSLYYRPAGNAFANLTWNRTADTDDLDIKNDLISTSFQLPMDYRSGILGALEFSNDNPNNNHQFYLQKLKAGFEWDSCCWTVRALFTDEFSTDENPVNSDSPWYEQVGSTLLSSGAGDGFYLQFSLKGLGGYESKIEEVLSDLPGYKGKLFDYQ